MAILAKKTGGGGRDLGPLAPGGMFSAVCVDVIDLGVITSTYDGKPKEQHKVLIVWQLNARDPQSKKRYLVARRYTLSLHEKADLRKDLQSWRGRPITREQELAGVDVEKLIGANCLVNVMHVTKGDRTYANVTAIMPKQPGTMKLDIEDYVRGRAAEVDADDHDEDPFDTDDAPSAPTPAVAAAVVPAMTDDEIPFGVLLPLLLSVASVLA